MQFERVRASISSRPASKSALESKVRVMKLKASAVGDPSVPEAERLCVQVAYDTLTGPVTKAVFVSTQWVAGRVLDWLVRRLGIPGANLILALPCGTHVPLSLPLGPAVQQGDTLIVAE